MNIREWLDNLKVGDTAVRLLAGEIRMELVVTGVTEDTITCGAWKFSRVTSGEVDEELGWDGIHTGSQIVPPSDS